MMIYMVLTVMLAWFGYRLAPKLTPQWCAVPATVLGAALVLSFGLTALGGEKEELSKNLIVIASEDQFQTEVFKSEIPVVVDFYADWCPPCQRMLPIMSQLSDEWQGKIKFVKVNVDKFSALAEKYEVNGIPDVRIFVAGKPAGKYVGFQDRDEWTGILKGLVK